MELNLIPIFKQLLKSKTTNYDRNKAYYQLYNVKINRAFHKQANIKQHIYKNMLWSMLGWFALLLCDLRIFLTIWTKKNHSPRATVIKNTRGKKFPVWLCQSLTDYLQEFPCGVFFSEGQNIDLGYGTVSIRGKEVRRRSSSGGRETFSDRKGFCGGFIIRRSIRRTGREV